VRLHARVRPLLDISAAYVVGDMVSAYGSIYRAGAAVAAGTAPPNSPWIMVYQGTATAQLS
jgi:hypothetical protein